MNHFSACALFAIFVYAFAKRLPFFSRNPSISFLLVLSKNFLPQSLKRLLNLIPLLSRYFQKGQPKPIGQFPSLLIRHTSLSFKVMLGCEEDSAHIFRCMGIDLLHPSLYIRERTGICDWVGEDNPCCSSVVSLGDVLEPFLPRSIPDLHLDLFIFDHQWLDLEVDSYGGNISVFEMIFAEPGY